MSLKKLVESINELVASEEEIADVQDTTVDIDDTTLEDTVEIIDYSTTDKLDAKTKISRAFDVLKKAFDDFQTDIVEDIEISSDSDILRAVEELEASFDNLGNAIAPKEDEQPEEVIDQEVEQEVEVSDESDEDEGLEQDFDAEATIDFSNVEDEENAD